MCYLVNKHLFINEELFMAVPVKTMRSIFSVDDTKFWLRITASQVLGEPLDEDEENLQATEAFIEFKEDVKNQLDVYQKGVDSLTEKMDEEKELAYLESFEDYIKHSFNIHLSKFFRKLHDSLDITVPSFTDKERDDRYSRIGAQLGMLTVSAPTEEIGEAFRLWVDFGKSVDILREKSDSQFLLNRIYAEEYCLGKVVEDKLF